MSAHSPRDVSSSGTSSRELLHRAQAGDPESANRLFSRYLPSLHRWGHRRVPPWARGMLDTADLVQDAVLQVFRRVGSFQPQGDGALLGYLRRSLINRIRDHLRATVRHPVSVPLEPTSPDPGESPFYVAFDHQNRERYLAALKRLRVEDRRAIVARLELEYSYEQVALVLGKPSAEAARLAIRRALVRLAHEMNDA
jgi:RNA polymerase sigma-70 factor, ECF subfamily